MQFVGVTSCQNKLEGRLKSLILLLHELKFELEALLGVAGFLRLRGRALLLLITRLSAHAIFLERVHWCVAADGPCSLRLPPAFCNWLLHGRIVFVDFDLQRQIVIVSERNRLAEKEVLLL